LVKRFDDFTAVAGVDLNVRSGTIYGLVGPNGAGKTTIIKMLICLIQPSSGEAEVDGHSILGDPVPVKSSIGYLAENSYLYEDMTVRSYLRFFASLYALNSDESDARISRLLEELRISDRADSAIGNLSKGLQRRVAIARALLHDPPILILDEVTSGLDPMSTHDIREYLKRLRALGKTILLSTHNLYEAELLCDDVTILDRGRVIASGSIGELKKAYLLDGESLGSEAALERIFFKAVGQKESD
jgi:ABC-2 type transport system ATP-binding protein